jgi:hypothetical protein
MIKKNSLRIFGLLAYLLVISAASAETISGVPLTDSFKPLDRAATMVTVSDTSKANLKDIKRVALSSFQVQFVTKGAAGASSYKIGQKGSATTNVQLTLVGLQPADFQAITDKIHADFVTDLKAMNIEVVPTEQILAAAAYKKMAATGRPAPAETRDRASWSTLYAPAGLALYGVGSSANPAGMFGILNSLSETSATMFANGELAKELDATVFVVRLVVNFVDTKSSNASWFGRSSGEAKVEWSVGPSVMAEETTLTISNPMWTTNMKLKAPLMIDGAAFKEIKDTSSIAGNVALALFSLAAGQGGSASAIDKEAIADPEKYRALVGSGVAAVREMFMARLQAGK